MYTGKLFMITNNAVEEHFNVWQASDYIKELKPTPRILKQIVLLLYDLFFCQNVIFEHIECNQIYCKKVSTMKLKYTFCKRTFHVVTNEIVKIDIDDCGLEKINPALPQHYRRLYEYIFDLMPILSLKEFILSFIDHNDDSRIVHPMKVLDSILSAIVMECHA